MGCMVVKPNSNGHRKLVFTAITAVEIYSLGGNDTATTLKVKETNTLERWFRGF